MSTATKPDYCYKLVLIGSSGSGKTQIISTLRGHEENTSRIGIDMIVRQCEVNGMQIKTQIWDTAGQERYTAITRAYYRGCSGIFLVYNISCLQSFEDLEHWIKDIRKHLENSVNPRIMLLAHKLQENDEVCVTAEMGETFAIKNNLLFKEIKSYDGASIIVAYQVLVENIHSNLILRPHSHRQLDKDYTDTKEQTYGGTCSTC